LAFAFVYRVLILVFGHHVNVRDLTGLVIWWCLIWSFVVNGSQVNSQQLVSRQTSNSCLRYTGETAFDHHYGTSRN